MRREHGRRAASQGALLNIRSPPPLTCRSINPGAMVPVASTTAAMESGIAPGGNRRSTDCSRMSTQWSKNCAPSNINGAQRANSGVLRAWTGSSVGQVS